MFLGPALVHYKPSNGTNLTQTFLTLDLTNVFDGTQSEDDVKASIDIYMDILAGVAVLLFGLFVLYFPSKPPQPPAFSSAIERTEFVTGIKTMLSNKDVLLACLAYSVPGMSIALFLHI